MTSQPLQVIKTVSALPDPLEPNTFYLVRVGQGYDLYATDTTGSSAYKINVSPNQLTDVIPVTQGGTGAKNAVTARGNLGIGTKANLQIASIQAGSSAYKKGWRKLIAVLPGAAGEFTIPHGVTTVETLQAKVTNSDGIVIYNNDINTPNQFYVRVNGANLVLGVTANSTKVFSKVVTIYVGEEVQ